MRCGARHVWSPRYDIAMMELGAVMPADADVRESVCDKPAGHPVDVPFDCHESAGGTCWPDVPTVVARFEDR